MRDPTRRSPGAWPRDHPIRWRGVAGGIGWFVVDTAAFVAQLLLVIPLLVITSSDAGDALGGSARLLLAIVWGGLTLASTWCWILRLRRGLLIPIVTATILWLAAGLG